jgi:putative ABC transport system ATP-binding protein
MNDSHDPLPSADQALRALEAFAAAAGISFDRLLAARTLGEAERAVPGEDDLVWAHRLVEVGDSVGLRVRAMECSVHNAMTFVRQGIPVAALVQQNDGRLQGILLKECRGRRVLTEFLDRRAEDQWLGVRQVAERVSVSSPQAPRRWVMGQSALACDANQSVIDEASHEHLPPWTRLIRLLRPERRDLWVILTFSLVTGVLALATPIAVEALVNTVAFGRYLQPIVVLSILLFTFLAFAAAMRGLLAYVVEILQRRLFVRVVEDLAYRLPRVQQTAWDREHGPGLVNYFFDVVTLQKVSATLLLDGLSVVLQTVVGMIVLAFYHPFLLGFDALLLLLIAFVTFGLGFGAVKSAIKESKAKFAVGGWLEQLTQNPTAFKLNGGTRLGLEKADQLAIGYLDARRAHFRILMRQILFALGLQAVAATVLLGLGGWLVIQGQLTLGQLVAAELIVMMIVGSFAKIGKHLESYYDLMAAVDKLGHLFDLPIEAHDKLFHLQERVPAELNVADLSYAYDKKNVLNNVSLRVDSGKRVALVGAPGSGKSTLIDLICGVRQPTSGHIEIDKIDLRELRPDSLRQHIGTCRATEIFLGTIDENVHLGRPDISAEDVRESLQTVGLLDELLRLPEGLNSQLNAGGAPLSTSQAVRLMVARAMVGRPRLLLIDGTLDLLGDEMALTVMDNLSRRPVCWTLLLCTGRKSLIDRCESQLQLQPEARKSDDDKQLKRSE